MQNSGRIASALALAVGLVVSAWIVSDAFVRIRGQDQLLTVTGSAKRRIVSDWIVWRADISVRAPALGDAYKQLSTQVPQAVDYLKGKGVAAERIEVSSVRTTTYHPRHADGYELDDVVSGYGMTQTITVSGTDVEKIAVISRGATELINQGILLQSQDPEYHYTKLSDLKIEMLAEAARDAKLRAEQIASSTGAKVGSLKAARMGVMQINPAGSSETSSEGNNDVTSLAKDVTAVVTGNFQLE